MATIRDILRMKGSQVFTIDPEATVLEAAERMNEHKIGSLVVCENQRLAGIVTERDVLRRVVVPRRDPGTTKVREVMTAEVACCQMHTTLDEARSVMKNRRFRHLPVIEGDGRVCGLISIGDLNAHDSNTREQTIHFLEAYIHGQA